VTYGFRLLVGVLTKGEKTGLGLTGPNNVPGYIVSGPISDGIGKEGDMRMEGTGKHNLHHAWTGRPLAAHH